MATYGRHVVVVAGKGNNGADGRVAAARLARRGARVTVVDAVTRPSASGRSAPCDLVIDAAYGTGFRGHLPRPGGAAGVPVLAVDIPSGVNGDTGEACGEPLRADVTVTFAALKTGLVQGDGPLLAGRVEVADIGLDVSGGPSSGDRGRRRGRAARPRRRDAHKWQSAVAVVAGSPGMTGAAGLCARAAYRAGAGMVRLGIPGGDLADLPVSEAVGAALPADGWSSDARSAMAERCRALVVGPGLGRADATVADVRGVVARADAAHGGRRRRPLCPGHRRRDRRRGRPRRTRRSDDDRPAVVLTPHDGEFARLAGAAPGTDRIAAAGGAGRGAAARWCCSRARPRWWRDPAGTVLLATAGSPRLATAGTGDVLSGVIGAFLARGVDPSHAAALAAHVHGRAAAARARRGPRGRGPRRAAWAEWLSGVRR